MSWWKEKDHPVWKIIQSVIALAGLIIWVTHMGTGGHEGLADISDTSGVVGVGLGGKLFYDFLKHLS